MRIATKCTHGQKLNAECAECFAASAKLTADIDAAMTPYTPTESEIVSGTKGKRLTYKALIQ